MAATPITRGTNISGDGFLWGDAEVTYPDWVGTAQLDEKMTTPTIHDLVDLDYEEWLIVGIDIGGGETNHDIKVLAVRQDPNFSGSWVAPEIAANNNGEIPVTEFLLHDVDPYAFLKSITHMFEMRLKVQSFEQFPIRVVEQSDIPEQT